MFKVGDKVRCVHDDNTGNVLSKGTVYTVEHVSNYGVRVQGDLGYPTYAYRWRFEKVEDKPDRYEYHVCVSESFCNLERYVTNRIQDGWVLQGGVSICAGAFAQAMTRKVGG